MEKRGDLSDLLVPDPWKELRTSMNLYRAVEPSIELVGITEPSEKLKTLGVSSDTLPAYTARHCWESDIKYTDDQLQNTKLDKELIRKLIQLEHTTPFQSVNYVFDVFGTSKSVQAQWTRHKVGVGWSYRSTRFVEASGNEFVYCTYDYIKDEDKVKELLRIDEEHAKKAVEDYDIKRKLGATKQDARKIMPVEFATHCSFFANARALRHLFNLRLTKKAEWEIRRMSAMMLEEAMKITPTIFEDIYEKTLEKFG